MNLSFGRRNMGNFRINIFWQRNSIAIVVRYILGEIPRLESLGLPQVLAEVIMEKRGLVLVVGATGSGKSTTIASMLDHRNENRSGHILTIEDPIEYLFKHKMSIVNQREIGQDTLDWQNALRNAMRQAPDCILIGEIRDKETMGAALAYAQTGHLCLGTLHANNAYHALNRIFSFFPTDARALLSLDLAATLKCIISQRLIKRPDGGRIPAVEILLNSRQVAELIERSEISAIREAMEQSLAQGSRTFEQDLFRLYKDKVITLEEALANSDSPTNLSWLINNAQFGNTNNEKSSRPPSTIDFESTEPDGSSFREFTLELDDD
jgi:twitching motility protein PilU